jgi:hypothetical protein
MGFIILINFVSTDLTVSIFQAGETEKLLDFHLLHLEVAMVQKTYNMTVMLRIGGISLVHCDPVTSVCLLDTPMASGNAEYLFTVLYVDVSSDSSAEVDTKLKCITRIDSKEAKHNHDCAVYSDVALSMSEKEPKRCIQDYGQKA